MILGLHEACNNMQEAEDLIILMNYYTFIIVYHVKLSHDVNTEP